MSRVPNETGLLSPAPSERSDGHVPPEDLPKPRSRPLTIGSPKSQALISYLDERVLQINSRYAKSFAADPNDKSTNRGYTTFEEVVSDLSATVDILWVSNTPSIQLPFLITLSGLFQSTLHSFPWVMTTTLQMAAKLDSFFAHLLSNTGASNSKFINNTDRARINSLAQETRLEMFKVASRENGTADTDTTGHVEEYTDVDESTDDEDLESVSGFRTGLTLGNVYEKTLSFLGGDLQSLPAEEAAPDAPHSAGSDVEIIEL